MEQKILWDLIRNGSISPEFENEFRDFFGNLTSVFDHRHFPFVDHITYYICRIILGFPLSDEVCLCRLTREDVVRRPGSRHAETATVCVQVNIGPVLLLCFSFYSLDKLINYYKVFAFSSEGDNIDFF